MHEVNGFFHEPTRTRLPNRRPSHVRTLQADDQRFEVCIGFDPLTGAPKEVFLNAGKEGSLFSRLLADSVGRLPGASPLNGPNGDEAASPIGAVLDLLAEQSGGAHAP